MNETISQGLMSILGIMMIYLVYDQDKKVREETKKLLEDSEKRMDNAMKYNCATRKMLKKLNS